MVLTQPDPKQVNYTVYLDKKANDYDVVPNVTSVTASDGVIAFFTNGEKLFPSHVYPIRQIYRVRKQEQK